MDGESRFGAYERPMWFRLYVKVSRRWGNNGKVVVAWNSFDPVIERANRLEAAGLWLPQPP